MSEYHISVAIPYIDGLVSNINARFSDVVVTLLVSSSVLNPASIPIVESGLPDYGNSELQALAEFYGKEATVEFGGTTYTVLVHFL